jgi:hypothetical protein
MSFMPVMFACFINGGCNFVYDKAHSKEQCQIVLKQMSEQADESPAIVQYSVSCLEVEFADGRLVSG